MAVFICPACDHRQTVPDAHIGRTAKCPECDVPSIVQAATATDNSNAPEKPQERQRGSGAKSRSEPDRLSEPENCADEAYVVLRESGGSIQTTLTPTRLLNGESSLEREFITIIHKGMPAGLAGCFGVTTVYEPETDDNIDQHVFASRFAVKALEDIHAFQVRFVLFSIWGGHIGALSATEIADMSAGEVRRCESTWDLFDENEVHEFYASIAYLAAIRTAAGRVYTTDTDPVVAEARKFSADFTEADLAPKPAKR